MDEKRFRASGGCRRCWAAGTWDPGITGSWDPFTWQQKVLLDMDGLRRSQLRDGGKEVSPSCSSWPRAEGGCRPLVAKRATTAKNSVICVHLILSPYNLPTDADHVTGLARKLLVTSSITQAASERSLSTATFMKDRLNIPEASAGVHAHVQRDRSSQVFRG